MGEEQTKRFLRIDWWLGLTWLSVTIAAALLAVGLSRLSPLGEELGSIFALLLFATLQWLVLRYALAVSAWWIPATVLGLLATGWAMILGLIAIGWGGADETLLYVLTIGGALLLGVVQGLILGRDIPMAILWPLATVISVILLLQISTSETLAEQFYLDARGPLGFIVTYGLLSGLALVALTTQKPAARPVSWRTSVASLALMVSLLLITLHQMGLERTQGVSMPESATEFVERIQEGGFNFTGIQLPGAELSGVDLTMGERITILDRADLTMADLSRAHLSQIYLRDAILTEANLDYADLSEAQLSDADLRGASLRYANLKGCDLRKADLSGSDLEGADLLGAFLNQTRLESANLTGARILPAQLENAASLAKATMPDGSFYHSD